MSLGGSEILHGVSLDARHGEAVALMGGNGSGKSTFVRAMVGALPITAGVIEFDGRPASAASRAAVGYVPQRTTAAGGVSATVAEVVSSGLLSRSSWWPGRGARARVDEALAVVGIADLAGTEISHLSGGQQQRALIARALVRRPHTLVLDEPMAGVDLHSQVAFAHALAHLKDDGAAIVIVLHELGALARHIDHAVVLEHGCVTHVGAPPEDLGVHALPGHDHEHAHDDPQPRPRDALGLEHLDLEGR